jgi:hypothetical protein
MTRLGKDIGLGCGLIYVLSCHSAGGTEENHENLGVGISDALDEIQTKHLPNASL